MAKQILTQIFAESRGVECPGGLHRCWYCGGACDDSIPRKDWVKPTTTVWQYARASSSDYVCAGCAESLAWKSWAPVFGEDVPRGRFEHPEKRFQKPARILSYSWVVTPEKSTAYTKAHIAELRRICLDPPNPPFGIVLADSGQKQQMWLGEVNLVRDPVSVLLEEERIDYVRSELAERIDLASRVCAATGKPALSEPAGFNAYRNAAELFGDEEGIALVDAWNEVREEPMSRLAAWLCPNKEDSRGIHCADAE